MVEVHVGVLIGVIALTTLTSFANGWSAGRTHEATMRRRGRS